jgi:hypothetical protein
MMETEPAAPAARAGVARRALGVVALLAAVLALVLWGLGLVNPWGFTVLTYTFGQPGVGLLIAAVLVFVAVRLLAPVRSEAAHQSRARVQIAAVIAAAVGLICWGCGSSVLNPGATTVLARSADGDRAVVLVEYSQDNRELHVWAGSGLGERDVGVLGLACGQGIEARFLDPGEVEVETVYGNFRVRLDPATGAPLESMGDTCSGD